MTAITSPITMTDEIPAARRWRTMQQKAFPMNGDSSQRDSDPQPDYIPIGRGNKSDNAMEQNEANFFNSFHQPSLSKRKKLLSGESRVPCTPWRTKDYTCDPPGLHEEIIDFYEYARPRPSEFRMRREVVMRVTHIILSKWPNARVECFGSFCTGLFLPTSDIDLVVFGSWRKLPLFSLEEAFRMADIAVEGSILVLDKTVVPIIKFIDKMTEVKVDISFNHDSGIKSAFIINSFMQQYPVLAKLVMVLKQFLTQRQLNEVYYGGISSYSLILLLVSFLQVHPRQGAANSDANLGVLLIEFFELYGRHFNYMKTGISVMDGGSYFPKDENPQDDNAFLYIQDPVNYGDNASRGCFGMWQVKQAFESAFLRLNQAVITRENPTPKKESLLSLVINISKEVDEYRNWVDSNWPTPPLSPPTTPTHPFLMPMVPFLHNALPYMPPPPIPQFIAQNSRGSSNVDVTGTVTRSPSQSIPNDTPSSSSASTEKIPST